MSDVPDYVRGPGLRRPHRIPQDNARPSPAHCGWAECRCTHTYPCVAGWIDSDEDVPEIGEGGQPRTRPDGTPVVHQVTRPCPNCRPEAAQALADPMLTRGQQLSKIRKRKER